MNLPQCSEVLSGMRIDCCTALVAEINNKRVNLAINHSPGFKGVYYVVEIRLTKTVFDVNSFQDIKPIG